MPTTVKCSLIVLEGNVFVYRKRDKTWELQQAGEQFTSADLDRLWDWWKNALGDQDLGFIMDLCILADESTLEISPPMQLVEESSWSKECVSSIIHQCMGPYTVELVDKEGTRLQSKVVPLGKRRELFLLYPALSLPKKIEPVRSEGKKSALKVYFEEYVSSKDDL